MEYLILLVSLKNRPVLVVGGGCVAARKIKVLYSSGARIKVVSDILCSQLIKMSTSNKIAWIGKKFIPSMLDGIFLVVVATDDHLLNSFIYQHAEDRKIFINVVDDTPKCSFIFPAIVNRNPILVGISSCGLAPVLVRILREKLESLLPSFLGSLAILAGFWRNKVKQKIFNISKRRRFWEIMFNGKFANLVSVGDFRKAGQLLQNTLNKHKSIQSGSVALVGAGPGDQGLMTLRGLQLIQQADVILYDYLVSKDVLDLVRRDSVQICVGKRSGSHSISQDEINNLLVNFAKQGKQVVRLKGGDPFIFGRGGEELQILSNEGISFQVVPGITAVLGAAAYAGIPLTHRFYSSSIVLISGYLDTDFNKLNWKMLTNKYQTLVIYMGILHINRISQLLIINGSNPKTPVAIISNATCKNQVTLISDLEKSGNLAKSIRSPALLIIGDVVLCHHKMNWFINQDINIYKNSLVNFK